MKMERLSKTVVSLVAGVLLLVCQTTAAANSCALPVTVTEDSSTVQPCHDATLAVEDGSSSSPCSIQCASPGSIPATVKVTSVMPSDVPVLPLHPERQYVAFSAVPPDPPDVMGAPPRSLPIVHCRLLN